MLQLRSTSRLFRHRRLFEADDSVVAAAFSGDKSEERLTNVHAASIAAAICATGMGAAAADSNVAAALNGDEERAAAYARAATFTAAPCDTRMGADAADSVVAAVLSGDNE